MHMPSHLTANMNICSFTDINSISYNTQGHKHPQQRCLRKHFDKIRHHCPIIAKSFLAFIPRLKPWAFPPDFCKNGDRKNFPIPDYFYKVTPFFSRSFLADSTESTPVGFLTGANAFSRSTSNGQQLSIIWIMSRINDSNL